LPVFIKLQQSHRRKPLPARKKVSWWRKNILLRTFCFSAGKPAPDVLSSAYLSVPKDLIQGEIPPHTPAEGRNGLMKVVDRVYVGCFCLGVIGLSLAQIEEA